MRITKDNAAFFAKLRSVAENLGIPADWLEKVIWFESRFDPQAQNKDTKATGLIQFMPSTLKGDFNLTTEQVFKMDGLQQLDLVYKYYARYKGKYKTVYDLYFATFYPLALLKDEDYIIGSEQSDQTARNIARVNPGFDLNKDGYITKSEIYEKLKQDFGHSDKELKEYSEKGSFTEQIAENKKSRWKLLNIANQRIKKAKESKTLKYWLSGFALLILITAYYLWKRHLASQS